MDRAQGLIDATDRLLAGKDPYPVRYPENERELFGKDEVGGSNPPSSSKTTPEIFGFQVFSFAFCNFLNEYDFADFR